MIQFISDLHLDGNRPELLRLFQQYMQETALEADSLYILGDLFEAWIGDDDNNPDYRAIVNELRQYSDNGRKLYIMHGNRDFLLGQQFATDTGCTLIDDPTVIDLFGRPVVLLHGDSLCTDDEQHMAFRAEVRGQRWQKDFLSKSLAERQAIARELRRKSMIEKTNKPEAIMDVNADTVKQVLREHGVDCMIHGHTHRPAMHQLDLDGATADRIVLGDWHENQGSVLKCTADSCDLVALSTGSD
jgi:UDP-2,3-diacylglucosamine hydrolase